MGTVAFFAPIPMPKTNRAAKSPCHDCAKPEPIGQAVKQHAAMKISPLRPKYLLRGSTIQAPLQSNLATDTNACDKVYSHETGCQEDDGVDKTDKPLVSPRARTDAELGREGQVSSIGTSLIPTLRSGSNGTQRNRVPKHERAVPFVVPLVYECRALFCSELVDHLEIFCVTCYESSSTEKVGVLGQTVRLSEGSAIRGSLIGTAALWEK